MKYRFEMSIRKGAFFMSLKLWKKGVHAMEIKGTGNGKKGYILQKKRVHATEKRGTRSLQKKWLKAL